MELMIMMAATQLRIAAAVAVAMLAGCAASRGTFYDAPGSISNVQLCRTLSSAEKSDDYQFTVDVRKQVTARGLTYESCRQLVSNQNAGIAAALLIGVAAVAVARSGGGGGYAGVDTTATYDTEWDWDQFYNATRQLVWACRGVQTGQFAESRHCAGRIQSDWRWPSKELR